MKTFYNIKADHPIFKRIDLLKIPENEFNEKRSELKDLGYENIKVEPVTYYEDGDKLLIDTDFIMKIHKSNIYIKSKQSWEYLLKDVPLPQNIVFSNERVDRERVFLSWTWEMDLGLDGMSNYNLDLLEELGYHFIRPEWRELHVIECPDKYLNEYELVEKYLMLQNTDMSVGQVRHIFNKVKKAMDKNGIVFYRP